MTDGFGVNYITKSDFGDNAAYDEKSRSFPDDLFALP